MITAGGLLINLGYTRSVYDCRKCKYIDYFHVDFFWHDICVAKKYMCI